MAPILGGFRRVSAAASVPEGLGVEGFQGLGLVSQFGAWGGFRRWLLTGPCLEAVVKLETRIKLGLRMLGVWGFAA